MERELRPRGCPMNMILVKTLAAFVPVCVLFDGSVVLSFGVKTAWCVLHIMTDGTGLLTGPDQSHSLDPFDCREPGRCAVVVESRLNPVRLYGGDVPSTAGVERRSQLFLSDRVRASIGTLVTKAQHI
jgi:hypothetical protein